MRKKHDSFVREGIYVRQTMSLYSEYVKASSLMLAVSMLVATVVCILFQQNVKDERSVRAIQEAGTIDQAVASVFDRASQIMQFTGNEIAQHSQIDLKTIQTILSAQAFTLGNNKGLSWSLLDWVDTEQRLCVNSVQGILEQPIPLSSFSGHFLDPKEPWFLQFAEPTHGLLSKEWVLPAGMVITSGADRHLGSLTLGLNLAALSARVENAIRHEGTVFALLDPAHRVVIASKTLDKQGLLDVIKSQGFTESERFVEMATPISLGNTTRFRYSKPMLEYPFHILIGEDLGYARRMGYIYLLPHLVELLGMALLGIALLHHFQKKVGKSMRALTTAATALATETRGSGVIHLNLPYFDLVEMDELAGKLREIKNVNTALRDAKREIENAHYTTRKRNVRLEDKAQERAIELEKALSSKTDFLNNLSHEIRTPIHGITAISQGLVDHWGMLSEEARQRYASDVAENAARLLSLVSNLLDLSKFTAGNMRLKCEEIDLGVLIKQIEQEYRSIYLHHTEVELRVLLPEFSTYFMAEADPERLLQLLRNLLHNAMKFMKKGQVTLQLKEGLLAMESGITQAAWVITVADEGVGIPKRELEEIFAPFSQSSFTKTYAGGTGLGLSICREIAKSHHGTIHAENRYNEKRQLLGAVFTVMLPMHQPTHGTDLLEKQPYYLSSMQALSPGGMPRQEEAACTPSFAQKLALCRILVVDDEPSCITSLELILYNAGCQLSFASTAKEALEALSEKESLFDIILLDLMLPDMSGLEILRHIRATPGLRGLNVILQTGAADPAELTEAYAIGIETHILKPYQTATVMAALQKVLG